MPKCKMHLPSNVSCPHEATYVVLSRHDNDKGEPAQRFVCVSHLGAAIDHDMLQRTGVRVAMAAFVDDAAIAAARETIYAQVEVERRAQIAARRRDDLARSAWLALIDEHRERAVKMKKSTDDQSDEYRHRIVTIAALCVAAIEAHDRSGRKQDR